jgi:hypothetical protein
MLVIQPPGPNSSGPLLDLRSIIDYIGHGQAKGQGTISIHINTIERIDQIYWSWRNCRRSNVIAIGMG